MFRLCYITREVRWPQDNTAATLRAAVGRLAALARTQTYIAVFLREGGATRTAHGRWRASTRHVHTASSGRYARSSVGRNNLEIHSKGACLCMV